MDVHIGREQVTSWRDYLVRYSLIVLSILTAWALSQWNEARNERKLAAQTRLAIDAELGNNLRELREAISANERSLAGAQGFRRNLMNALRDKQSPARIDAEFVKPWQAELRDLYPTLRRDAWEAAIAAHALAHIDPDALRRYATAYASQHDLQAVGGGQLSSSAATLRTRFTEWAFERYIGQGDPRELARLLLVWAQAISTLTQQMRGVERDLAAALGQPPLAAPSEPAAAAAASAASR